MITGLPGSSVSAAIAELHTDHTTWVPDEDTTRPPARGVPFAGVMYPALSRDLRVDNVALLPDAVRNCLRLGDAKLIEVVKVKNSRDFALELRDVAALAVADDGLLTWRAAPPVQSLPPGEARALGRGETHRFYETSEIGVQGKHYRIEPGHTIERMQTDEVVVRDLSGAQVAPTQ